eukprot:1447402-Prymnesium_polylepis.1
MTSGFFIPPWRSLRRRRSGSVPPPKRVYQYSKGGQHMANTVNTANAARASMASGARCASPHSSGRTKTTAASPVSGLGSMRATVARTALAKSACTVRLLTVM